MNTMNRLQVMGGILTKMKKENKMVCPNCGAKVKVMNFSLTTSDDVSIPFDVNFQCLACNAEFEIEGKFNEGEVQVVGSAKREYTR